MIQRTIAKNMCTFLFGAVINCVQSCFFILSLNRKTHVEVVEDGSQCAGSGGDGRVLPADLGHGHLGVHALQEGGEEVVRGWHRDNTTGRTQHQPAGRHLHSDR